MKIVCPTCRRVLENAPDDHPSRPFCSGNCKLADLDNWLRERYRIATDEVENADGDPGGSNGFN